MKTKATISLMTVFLGFFSASLFAQEIVVNPNAGGLKKKFNNANGKAISHPVDFPTEGKGPALYLQEVCRSFGHDEIVAYEVLQAQAFDPDRKQWLAVDTSPRIYKSITCTVYLK